MLKKFTLAVVLIATALTLDMTQAATAWGDEPPPLEGVFANNFNLLDPPIPAPREAFTDLANRPVRLSDFKGRVVLLNFWATWCPPCIREMPSLDRLAARLKKDGLLVVAVSEDRGKRDVIQTFVNKLGLRNLGVYHDPKGALARSFTITGLPTTFLIDAQGQVVGGMPGPAEWDSPEALALIRHYLQAIPAKGGVVKTGG